ncbi:MAG: hypothetical protein AMXMBFR75_16310, partial [Candidatus Hinthialibacteria bacterium]
PGGNPPEAIAAGNPECRGSALAAFDLCRPAGCCQRI